MDTLIDRYIAAVSEILPAKQRKDTATEIRSLIQDALDDRSHIEGRNPDDEMVVAVLKEFGPPEKIAAPYLPERYLIGPHLYPTFLLVLRIALPIIAVLVLITSWFAPAQAGSMTSVDFLDQLIKSIANAFSAVVQAFGNIVLIFAILQWALPELNQQPKEWDPRKLKAVSKPDKIKRGELVTEIAFILLGLIVFNFYLDRVGIYNSLNGQWSFTPVLTPAFKAYIPWINLLGVLTIILNVILVRRNSWSTLTRVYSIVVNAFDIAIAASLMTHIQDLYTIKGAFGQFGAEGIFQSLLNQVFIIALLISIIVSAAKIIQLIIHLVRVRISTAGNPAM